MRLDAPQPTLGDDLLAGVDPIAAYLGEKPRRVYYMLENRDLPAFKLRGKWYARKSSLQAHFANLEAQGAAAASTGARS